MNKESFENRLKNFPSSFSEGNDYVRVSLRVPTELDLARRLVFYETKKVYGRKWWKEGDDYLQINSLTKFDIVATTIGRDFMKELTLLPDCFKDLGSTLTTRSRVYKLVEFSNRLNSLKLPFTSIKQIKVAVLNDVVGSFSEYAYHPFSFSFNIKYCYFRFLQEFFLTPVGFKKVFEDWREHVISDIDKYVKMAKDIKEELISLPEDPIMALLDYMKSNGGFLNLIGLNEIEVAEKLGVTVEDLRGTISEAHELGYIEMVAPFKFKLR